MHVIAHRRGWQALVEEYWSAPLCSDRAAVDFKGDPSRLPESYNVGEAMCNIALLNQSRVHFSDAYEHHTCPGRNSLGSYE